MLGERSEAYVAKQSEANIAAAERSEAHNILDIGRYNLKRVCSSAKSFEARVAGLKTFATTAEAAGSQARPTVRASLRSGAGRST